MVSFSQQPAVKQDTIFGAAGTNFRPFLFCDYFSKCQINGENFAFFVAFLENMNFTYNELV